METFNYETQKWESGPNALVLRRKQLEADIALLAGEKGQEFARFIGVRREKALSEARASLEDLKKFEIEVTGSPS